MPSAGVTLASHLEMKWGQSGIFGGGEFVPLHNGWSHNEHDQG